MKLEGKDVIGSQKLLAALALFPLYYAFFALLMTVYLWMSGRSTAPVTDGLIFGSIGMPVLGMITVRAYDLGLDVGKSLKPLILAAFTPSSSTKVLKVYRYACVCVRRVV